MHKPDGLDRETLPGSGWSRVWGWMNRLDTQWSKQGMEMTKQRHIHQNQSWACRQVGRNQKIQRRGEGRREEGRGRECWWSVRCQQSWQVVYQKEERRNWRLSFASSYKLLLCFWLGQEPIRQPIQGDSHAAMQQLSLCEGQNKAHFLQILPFPAFMLKLPHEIDPLSKARSTEGQC